MPIEIIECHGQSPPILLIHCSGLGARQFKILSHAFPNRHLIVPNLYGYGNSEPYSGPDGDAWRFDYQIIEKIISEQNEISIFGHSYGGFLALHAARQFGSRVKQLCLHEPVAWGALRSAGEDAMVDGFNSGVAQLFQKKLSDSEWCRRFINFWNGFGAWEELPIKRQKEWVALTYKIKSEVKSLCDDMLPHNHWSTIRSNTFITMGNESPVSQRAVCRILHKAISGSVLKEVQGGHLAPLTHTKDCMPLHVERLLI